MYSIREIYGFYVGNLCTNGWIVTYQLISEQEDRLEREFAVAKVEEVLKGWTKQIDDHCVVVTFGAEPPNEGDANATSEGLVDLGLILKLRMLGLHRLEFDGDLFTRDYVYSKVNVTCHGLGIRR